MGSAERKMMDLRHKPAGQIIPQARACAEDGALRACIGMRRVHEPGGSTTTGPVGWKDTH